MAALLPAPIAEPPAGERRGHGVALTLALGFGPPLAVLAGVAAASVAAAGAGPAALAWAVAPAAFAALLTTASAWRTLVALREVATWPAPPEPQPAAGSQQGFGDAGVEIDHRVRNTLQIAASLLSLELRRAGSSAERAALLRVQARLHSLSLVHRRSSAQDASEAVRLDLIAAEIADHLFADRPPGAAAVAAHPTLEPVSVGPERATAFALFVNEALMNARDHLDRGRTAGAVSLSLRAVPGDGALLSIGRPAGATETVDADDRAPDRRLMADCAEQLGATASWAQRGDICEVRLIFPSQRNA